MRCWFYRFVKNECIDGMWRCTMPCWIWNYPGSAFEVLREWKRNRNFLLLSDEMWCVLTINGLLARQYDRYLEYFLRCWFQKTFKEANERNVTVLFDQQIIGSFENFINAIKSNVESRYRTLTSFVQFCCRLVRLVCIATCRWMFFRTETESGT